MYTVSVRCIYGILGRETIKYTVTCGVWIRFWALTLHTAFYLARYQGPRMDGLQAKQGTQALVCA